MNKQEQKTQEQKELAQEQEQKEQKTQEQLEQEQKELEQKQKELAQKLNKKELDAKTTKNILDNITTINDGAKNNTGALWYKINITKNSKAIIISQKTLELLHSIGCDKDNVKTYTSSKSGYYNQMLSLLVLLDIPQKVTVAQE